MPVQSVYSSVWWRDKIQKKIILINSRLCTMDIFLPTHQPRTEFQPLCEKYDFLLPELVKFFHRFFFPKFHRNFLQRTSDFSFWCQVLLITRNFPEVLLSNSNGWLGWIYFLTGKAAERSFIAASNKDFGVNHDVSLSFLLRELVTSNRRSFWLPSWEVWVGEPVATKFLITWRKNGNCDPWCLTKTVKTWTHKLSDNI